ncbi:MAG TPA: hypothetical protein VFO41_15355 [Alphaproteobacteria bacterium]|nr:hypothetical protein [Alphaproteobacteria bacterium]
MIERLFEAASKLLYLLTAFVLSLLSLALVGTSAWHVVESVIAGDAFVGQILEAISLIVVGFAVFDVAKFIIEEEVLRTRELRSSGEARQSLTKFITIIVIVVCLEGLVMIFEAKEQGPQQMIYPAGVVAVGIFALIGLGMFQWFSRHAEEAERSSETKAEERKISREPPRKTAQK